MDRRLEPRFDVSAPAKVTILGHPCRELNCTLLEISATGVKLVADESLSVDAIVALELEDHFVLADVRHTQPRGDKYAIGAERIYIASKILFQGLDNAERVRTVVKDFYNGIRINHARPQAEDGSEPLTALELDAEQLIRLDRQLGEYFSQPVEQIVAAPVERVVEGRKDDASGSQQAPSLITALIAAPVSPRPATQVEELQATWPYTLATPLHQTQALLQPPIDPPREASVQSPIPPATQTLPETRTQAFQGPTPAKITKTATAKKPPEPARFPWHIPLAVGGAVTVGWWAFFLFGSSRNNAVAARPIAAVASSAQNGSKRHLEIRVIEPTWVGASSDGKELFGTLLKNNETKEIDYSEKALVNIKNTEGVQVIFNGKTIPLREHGDTGVLEFTATGYRFLP